MFPLSHVLLLKLYSSCFCRYYKFPSNFW